MSDISTTVVESENLVVGLTLLAHNGSTYLTEADPMAPARAMQNKAIALFLYLKG